MVDVTRLPANAFGYVPTPALVAPIEFTLRLEDYAALGGHMDHVRPARGSSAGLRRRRNSRATRGRASRADEPERARVARVAAGRRAACICRTARSISSSRRSAVDVAVAAAYRAAVARFDRPARRALRGACRAAPARLRRPRAFSRPVARRMERRRRAVRGGGVHHADGGGRGRGGGRNSGAMMAAAGESCARLCQQRRRHRALARAGRDDPAGLVEPAGPTRAFSRARRFR